MSMFTLAISCLTISNLPWFMDLTFRFLCNIPGSFAALEFTSITSHIHNCVLFLLWRQFFIFLELFLHWSPVAYWAPTDLWSSSLSVLYFAFSYCSWGSRGKNTEVVYHWTTFCQNTGHSKHTFLTTQEMTIHGHHQVVNTKIRLIIFFVAKDGEALHRQQK